MAPLSGSTRRWLQFRLRTLLAAMAVLGVIARWISQPILKVRREAAAVEAVKRASGWVEFGPKSKLPHWLGRFFDPEFGQPLIKLRFAGVVSDDDLAVLDELPDIQELYATGPKLTDAGLAHLEGLANLQTLLLPSARITDRGLEHLERLSYLRELDLDYTPLTDAGLKRLATLTNLRDLSLARTKITDEGLKSLGEIQGLEVLDVSETRITDDGLKSLAGLKALKSLNLTGTKITKAGRAQLKSLTQLAILQYNLGPDAEDHPPTDPFSPSSSNPFPP